MFLKKGRGALWVCIWNQGGRWTEKVWEPLIWRMIWAKSEETDTRQITEMNEHLQ
jgi:hypothetical protein